MFLEVLGFAGTGRGGEVWKSITNLLVPNRPKVTASKTFFVILDMILAKRMRRCFIKDRRFLLNIVSARLCKMWVGLKG